MIEEDNFPEAMMNALILVSPFWMLIWWVVMK